MTDQNFPDRRKLTFAQAEGREPLPQPLQLREVSQELRALLWEVFSRSLITCRDYPRMVSGGPYLSDPWRTILYDRHVRVTHGMADEFSTRFDDNFLVWKMVFSRGDYVDVFNFVQYVLRHPRCPKTLANEVAQALKRSRAAYTIVDQRHIYPIASEEEGAVIEKAFADLAAHELNGARAHLRTAGELINKGDFAGSVRESIHAVEAVARTLDPKASAGLAPALAALAGC